MLSICSALNTLVSFQVRTELCQRVGSLRAIFSIDQAWFLPRGVVMNSAQPPFSSKIGASIAHALGLPSAHSENTMPAGGEPNRLSKLSDPTTCQDDPHFSSICISFSRVRERSNCGKAWSFPRMRVCGSIAAQIDPHTGIRRID